MKNPVAPDALLDYLNCGCKGACNTKKSSCYNASKISVCERFSASIWSLCRTTGHFLLLVFDDFESSLTILSLVDLVFIMGSSPLDMSLKRVSAMDYNSF